MTRRGLLRHVRAEKKDEQRSRAAAQVSFFAYAHNNIKSFTEDRSFTIVVHANAAGESRVKPATKALSL
jgi:hypothetical protein